MKLIEKALEYMDILYKTACQKINNSHEAEELVQETYLCTFQALKNGAKIDNMKAYLFKTLNNRFFDSMRKKYKIPTVSYEEFGMKIAESQFDDGGFSNSEVLKTDEFEAIRRELAYLSAIYREVIVRFYMRNQSVDEIAKELKIPKGTVLSRLDTGRNKIREGVVKMESYANNSYEPERLGISMNGRCGLNNEPFNIASNLLDYNVLITAYEEPLTVKEIAESLGIAAAYAEDSVEKLVKGELMKKTGNKVFTDFLILDDNDIIRAINVQTKFADETFNELKDIFANLVSGYKKSALLDSFNDTQLYSYAVLSILHEAGGELQNSLNLLKFDDIPERPNGGKWLAIGTKYKSGAIRNELIEKYGISGKFTASGDEDKFRLEEWSTFTGKTHNYSGSISARERGSILYNIYKDNENSISNSQMKHIPHFVNYGFLSDDGKKEVRVPLLSISEYDILTRIVEEAKKEFIAKIFDKAVDMMKKNAIKYPKQIKVISNMIYTQCIANLPMCYIYKAAAAGIIELKEGINYPVMLLINKN